MIPLGLHPAQAALYLTRLFGSADFAVSVEVLDANEKPLGVATMLDGQINLQQDADVRRTGSLVISDPEGALDFDDSSRWSPRSIWADRLIRVRHLLEVPTVGLVRATAIVGVPVTLTRSGADVTVELQDKTARANRGAPPMTVKKGMNAVDAIESIMRKSVGEFRFRLPRAKRRLSRPYSVGWADEASPFAVCAKIAQRELGMQLLYAADGYLLLRKKPHHPCLTVPHVTGLPSDSADFTGLDNWVKVSGHKKSATKNIKGGGSITTTSQPQAIARIKPGHTLSAESLARKGVPWYWPRLEDADELRKLDDVKDRAQQILRSSERLEDVPALTTVPFFHADADDLVRVQTPDGPMTVRLGDCSIPLGVGGDMTIGTQRWVSKVQPTRVKGRVVRTRKVHHPKKGKGAKGGSK